MRWGCVLPLAEHGCCRELLPAAGAELTRGLTTAACPAPACSSHTEVGRCTVWGPQVVTCGMSLQAILAA